MLNPISLAFKKARQENRAALLTYTVAGDSSKKQSLNILKSISKNVWKICPKREGVAEKSQGKVTHALLKGGLQLLMLRTDVRPYCQRWQPARREQRIALRN